MEKVAILGAQGQLGRALVKLLGPERALPLTRTQADLRHPEGCIETLQATKPSVVFNAAAYTQVDLAEQEREVAAAVNAVAPGKIAMWCASHNVPLIHFSTDYVFSGGESAPLTEEDVVSPINFYGESKLEGEKRISESGGKFFIFRTSWVYDRSGRNFLTTMLRLGAEREALKVVNDQYGAPTFATDLARGAFQAFQKGIEYSQFPSGVYHLCNSGETTWFDFAKTIFEIARAQGVKLKVREPEPILASEFPTPARRPKNSRLSNEKLRKVFGISLPFWRDGLKACMGEQSDENL